MQRLSLLFVKQEVRGAWRKVKLPWYSRVMPPKGSPPLMFQQPNATSYFLAGTSLLPKLSADSQRQSWDTSLSLCPATYRNPLSPLICKFQLSMPTPQWLVASSALLILTWLADRAWFFTLVPSWFVISFHFLKSLGCLSYNCWIEPLPFLERSCPHVLPQIFFLRKEWLLGRKLMTDCCRSCFS